MSNESILAPGFYGKLPILGDFVSRRLPRDFIDQWDNWLQHSIAISKQELGEKWQEVYLTSPIWRFALTPGLCGENGWMGVVMPSVDRVGRYFPFTIAVPIQQQTNNPALFSLTNDWYLELEKVALATLEDELDLHSLEMLLNHISTVSVSTLLVKSSQNKGHNPFAPYHSLWHTQSSEKHPSTLLVFKGLPPVNEFSNLLGYRLFKRNNSLETVVEKNEQQQTHSALEKFNLQHPDNEISVVEEARQNQRWLSYGKTDKGNFRPYNQDAFLDRPDLGLWVVADGMGGHQAGDVASRMIIHEMNKLTLRDEIYACIGQSQSSLQHVNQTLRQFSAELFNNQTVGSTVIALLAKGNHFAYLWAGDSRLYRLRDKKLEQLSVDHSDGEDDSLLVPMKKSHVITRAVGAFNELELDCGTIEGRSGDKFLLCSDGLDNEVYFHEIEQVLTNNYYQNSVEALVALTLSRKAKDNVTVLVVEVL